MSISSIGSPSYSGSLLNPPNPSFAPIDSVPRGGILLNSRRGSDSPQTRPVPLPLLTTASSPGLSTVRSGFETPDRPSTPINETAPLASAPAHAPSSPLLSPADSAGHSARIRFAPLPDPRRPRSLSTGRNVVWKPTEGPSGETTRTVEIRGLPTEVQYDDEYDDASDGDDFARRKSDGEGDDDDEKRGRRWSKTMGSWGKGTKKLLGLKDAADEGYSEGAPLKKSVSTGGFIGTSPFRWSAETERKTNMQGLSPATPHLRDHRRNSSMEHPSGGSLSSSPQPVRMLNGRVYGSRRLIEAAEREKEWREKNEPAFIEWGHGKQGAGLGSNQARSSGFMDDAEEGSGMEWVKRRREERQRRAEEERRKAEGARAMSDSGASEGDPGGTSGDDLSPSKSERKTPIIQVSEHLSPVSRKPSSPWKSQAIPIKASPSGADNLSKSAPIHMEAEKEHITEAIQVPVHKNEDRGGRGVDIFGDGHGRRQSGGSSRSAGSRSSRSTVPSEAKDLDEEVLEDDEDSEEEDDHEYDDDEDEEDVPMPRTTSSAAGVEKVSRHKD